MNSIEPGGDLIPSQVAHAEDIGRVGIELELPVALGSRLRKRWGEVRASSFENKGTVHVNDRAVTILTSVSRLFRSPLRRDLTLRREDIFNARINGRSVLFELANGGELETIVVRTRNRDDARLLREALPTQMTRTYATENHEQLQFLEGINARTPHVWATWSIVTIAALVYFWMAARGHGRISPDISVAAGSNFGPYTQEGQWWRLLTSLFIHANFVHLLFNMIVLAQTGRIAERLFGTGRFIALYLLAGLTGSLVSLLWHPAVNSMGASGAIYGVLGAIVAYLLRHGSVVPRAFYLRQLHVAVAFIIYTLPGGFRHSGVDNGAHLGGLFGGFILGLVLAPTPDESTRASDDWMMTFGVPAAVTCALIGGMVWALVDLGKRPDRQDAMQFAKFVMQMVRPERQAIADVIALKRYPATDEGRTTVAGRIRGTLVPEWQRLYDLTEASQVPPNPSAQKVRRNLLTYYGETLDLLKLAANSIEAKQADDKVVPMLVQKVDYERTEVIKRGTPSKAR
ncbi:rhomboid family intramembrane serine protease [Paraburkholderia sp.]|uniref:rhomboid family intramembrane serine protease n=1 Tax=Paraburkholderia sp. TaxID=1926495 RepID=UPI0025E790F0|nr:rhomboid family intramembrane serine protease [Paraburkholderia sp.]